MATGSAHETAASSRPATRPELVSAPSRSEGLSHSQRKLLLNLHEELLAILTLLEPR